MKTLVKWMLAAACCCALLPWMVQGKVYRVVSDTGGRLNVVGLPWEFAYETTMDLNGRRNALKVYSARWDEPVAEQLAAQFESQGAVVKLGKSPDGGAIGTATWDGGEARIVIAAAGERANQIVFIFYPEAEVAATPGFSIAIHPRAQSKNIVANEQTRTCCATFSTTDSPEQVRRYYEDILGSDGWKPLLSSERSDGVAWFQKGEQSCCVKATSKNNGATLVTLLVRDA